MSYSKYAVMATFSARTEEASTTTDGEKDRDKQVIVAGFDRDTDADHVIRNINEFLNVGNRRAKVTEVTTFSDPTSIGVITFETAPAKIGFYKKIRNHGHKLANGKDLVFFNNETFEKRLQNKKLGQVKYQIKELTKYRLEDIRIDRKKNTVKVGGKLVAKIDAQGKIEYEMQFDEAIAKVKAAVDEWLEEYTTRRQIQDEEM